jgi:ADP-dependent NAD(P)H-hydrate dehydratase / NAD(P)H-hydrate epimerase
MKIFSNSQIRAWDNFTIAQEPIASIDLMERASRAFVERFINYYSPNRSIKVFCGLGNNGGDGLAVCRLLLERGYTIECYVWRIQGKASPDFALNYQRLLKLMPIQELNEIAQFPTITKEDVLIDALWGSGLNRALSGISADLINVINQSKADVVSIDIASGLFADTHTPSNASVIQPKHTFTFQIPKLAFLLPENATFVGNWEVLDIGLHQEYAQSTSSRYFYSDKKFIQALLRNRPKFSHKGTFGHALLMMGSFGKIGAAVLATQACLRSGVGLTTIQSPYCGYQILQTSTPEAMCMVDTQKDFLSVLPDLKPYSAVGIGCGIDKHPLTVNVLESLLREAHQTLVLDADALNILAENPRLLNLLPRESILTPHPKEFERLTRPVSNHFERLDLLVNFASVYQVYVILKGANSAIATPDGEVYFNSNGNSGMATGGSGDVLTGLLTGLCAAGYSSKSATLLGVFLHGLSGDIFVRESAEEALKAGDLIDNLGKAFRELGKTKAIG